MEKIITVPHDTQGERLDKFLSSKVRSCSRTRLRTLIQKGAVSVNGRVTKPSYQLRGGERIFLKVEEVKEELQPFDFEVKIIYEDQDVLVVDKPKDLTVHPPSLRHQKTLVNALLFMKKSLSNVSALRAGVVHRLDRETSGVMVLAKNNLSHINLVGQFRERKVKKEYRAICWGLIKKKHFAIDIPLARDSRNWLKMKISFLKSKRALTDASVLGQYKDSTYLALRPHTGRMHQIRVHLKFLGYPIVGDKKYGIKDSYDDLFLHAYKLGFMHPTKDTFVEFTSALPARFQKFIGARTQP
ncbi:MAG: RluA family pseudouridine synthase [Candidatus Omnitrophota bacterium]|nr:MAG: RluA family pseudouridine synthase [Candidatus Omnitrophota bacterium]